MPVTNVEVRPECSIPPDVSRRAKRFLFGTDPSESEEPEASPTPFGSTDRICPDTEESEDVLEWSEAVPETSKKPQSSSDWLGHCELNSYSDGDYLLATFGFRFVFFSKSPSGNEYKIESLQGLEDTEAAITSSCIIGLSNSRHSEQLDCVLIAVGTLNGFVYFFTEKGTLLLFERFSTEVSIRKIAFEQIQGSQMFIVHLRRVFYSVEVASLYSTLLQARSLIARGEKTADELSSILEFQCERLEPEFDSSILHVVYTGPQQPSCFDQYVTASMGSFFAQVDRPALPTYQTFAIMTEETFVAFSWHDGEETAKLWTEALNYGKSLIPSFGFRKFLGMTPKSERKTPLGQSRTTIPTRSSILDSRVAESCEVSPDGRYLAVVDRAARVLLIDVVNRQVAIVWKGYRDAKVAWVTTANEKRVAVFLIIHAPRRALLEVWTVESGIRIYAQHVDPDGFLLKGGDSSMMCGNHSLGAPMWSAYFVNSKGEFAKIDVPYHLALVTSASHDQHDQLLLKQLSHNQLDVAAFCKVFSLLKLNSSRRQAFVSTFPLLKDVVQARKFLEELAKHESSKALGDLPDKVGHSIDLFERLSLNRSDEARSDEKVSIELDQMSMNFVNFHLKKVRLEMSKREEIAIDEWLQFIDNNSERTDVFTVNRPEEFCVRIGLLVFSNYFNSNFNAEDFVYLTLENLPFSRKEITRLLFLCFTNYEFELSKGFFARFIQLMQCLEVLEKGTVNEVEKFALDCRNMSRALLLMAACFCARARKDKEKLMREEKLEEVSDKADDVEGNHLTGPLKECRDDWDDLAPDEHIDSLLRCMHACFLVQRLSGDTTPFIDVCSHVESYLREQIAVYAVRDDVELSSLGTLFTVDEASGKPRSAGDDVAIDAPEEASATMSRLNEMFPHCMSHDVVLCDVAWELVSTWFRDRELNFEMLPRSIEFVKDIVNCRLQHGLVRLIWDKFVASLFQSLATIVDKTKRAPKERECRKDLGFGEDKSVRFLVCCQELLAILLEAVRETPMATPLVKDALFENAVIYLNAKEEEQHLVRMRSREDSLVDIAVRQQLVNYHLVLHHQHLIIALRLQLSVGLRLQTIQTLFCAVGGRALFSSLDSHPLIPLDRVEDAVMERRHAFITKIAEQGSTDERKIAKVLASEWNLTVNSIALMQALAVLRLGSDGLAAQELTSVVMDDHAAASLARVLAARIIRWASSTKMTLTKAHTNYLCSVAGDEVARVECDEGKSWQESVLSLGRISQGRTFSPHSMVTFVRLNDISKQYWGVEWMG